jgi:F-type H+-transporting ATPase subunit b
MLAERENSIEEALKSADQAREQMAKLQSDNEALYKQAREERDQILKEAREMKDSIIGEAKRSAEEEGKRIIMKASEEISKQKAAAIAELKGQVATLSVNIAEKLINNQLSNSEEQQSIIAKQVNSLNNNQQAIA